MSPSMVNTQPIATYRERILCLIDRRFELYRDRVHVHGKSRGVKFDSVVLISDLAGSPNRVWLRSAHHRWASISLAILSVFIFVPIFSWPPDLRFLIPGLVGFFVGLIYLIRSSVRNEYRQYKNSVGVVILDFGCVGPEAEKFSEFANALDRAIEVCANN